MPFLLSPFPLYLKELSKQNILTIIQFFAFAFKGSGSGFSAFRGEIPPEMPAASTDPAGRILESVERSSRFVAANTEMQNSILQKGMG